MANLVSDAEYLARIKCVDIDAMLASVGVGGVTWEQAAYRYALRPPRYPLPAPCGASMCILLNAYAQTDGALAWDGSEGNLTLVPDLIFDL